MRKRPLLLIEWEDIGGYRSWRDEGNTDDVKTLKCLTVGWRQKGKKGYLHIASTRNNNDECCDMTVIPRRDIKSIRKLE